MFDAAEIMLNGRVSKAADVYSFGICLYEMYTGGIAFDGIPRALLGHQITREHKRPVFPDSTPEPYKRLAERCWQADWDARCASRSKYVHSESVYFYTCCSNVLPGMYRMGHSKRISRA